MKGFMPDVDPDGRMAHTDTSRLVGLTTPGARIILAMFMLCNTVFLVSSWEEFTHPGFPLVALVMVCGAALVLVRDYPDPFPWSWTLTVAAAVVASTLLVTFQLPDHGPVGRSTWHIGANTWLLFFLALRQRVTTAWVTFAMMAAITMTWGVSIGHGAGGLVDAQAAILLAATLFAVSLRRTARAINEYEGLAVAGAIEVAAATTAEAVRVQRIAELRADVLPLLERLIASNDAPTHQERHEYQAAEALLRDRVRGRSLVSPAVAQSATAARERGVEVVLLDDRGGTMAEDLRHHVLAAAVVALDEAQDGTVTVRLHPRGRQLVASIVSSTLDGGRRRLDIDDSGFITS